MIAWAMEAITDAARRIHRQQRCHRDGIELADLVQAAAERVLTYLGREPATTRVVVFVCAKQGALEHVLRWRNLPADTRRQPTVRPRALPYDESEGPRCTWRRCVPTPPMELMIDLLRELLRLRLADAYAWVTCRLHDDAYDVVARELGYSRGSIKNLVARGEAALRDGLADYRAPSWSAEAVAAKLLADGMGVWQVARRVGLEPDKVRAIQDRLDPSARARRDQLKARLGRPVDTAAILRLRRSGLTHKDIGAALGCSPATVGKYLELHGDPLIGALEAGAAVH